MILSLDKIKALIKSPGDSRILAARKMNKKLLLHVEGIGLQDFLSQINNYENSKQFEAREKFAISNKFITEELLRPTDNAFNARGGSKNFKFVTDSENKEVEFMEKLAAIRNSHSLDWYIENEWFNKYITDPNGLIMIESDGEDVPKNKRNAYPTYKSIQSIKSYEQVGMYVEYVVFEAHEVSQETTKVLFGSDKVSEIKMYWAIDDVNWYLVKEGSEISIEKILPHNFGRVPAVLCSDIIDNVTGWKKSPIDAQIELLDKLVTDTSVVNISEFFHLFPQQYLFADECTRCGGTGNIGQGKEWVDCDNPNCTAGKLTRRDVTDVILMRLPTENEPAIKEPGGFLSVPTNALTLKNESVERTWNRIFFSHWGAAVARDSGKDYSTATGRYIDAQPVNNRLNKYSKSIEKTHTAIADFLGKYYYSLTFSKAFIQYGRRYLIETPDQIWKKYVEAKALNAPVSSLDILLFQYIESEYRENETMYVVETTKAKLEPFIHWSIDTVRQSETIPFIDKQKKEYFAEWLHTKCVEDLYMKTLDELRSDLDKYVSTKEIPKPEAAKRDIETNTVINEKQQQ